MTGQVGCPVWCQLGEHQILDHHRSREIHVGPQPRHTGRGMAIAWLSTTGAGPTWLGLAVAHMAYCSVDLTLPDAASLWRRLGELLEQAGIDPVTGNAI